MIKLIKVEAVNTVHPNLKAIGVVYFDQRLGAVRTPNAGWNIQQIGIPNPPPTNKKIYLSNMENKTPNKHVEYSDQHFGAVHPILCNKDVKFMNK